MFWSMFFVDTYTFTWDHNYWVRTDGDVQLLYKYCQAFSNMFAVHFHQHLVFPHLFHFSRGIVGLGRGGKVVELYCVFILHEGEHLVYMLISHSKFLL